MLSRDLLSWFLVAVTMIAVKAGALAKRTMFHVRVFTVEVTNVKIPVHLLFLQLLMTMMMAMNNLDNQTDVQRGKSKNLKNLYRKLKNLRI